MKNQQELKETHATGFGGTDARMFAKIGREGIEALSTTEKKRILQALGRFEPTTFDGNVYTEAGHLFEDWYAEEYGKEMQREKRMESETIQPTNFKIFAHADFVCEADIEGDHIVDVHELKFSQEVTDKVLVTYYYQLQWYYLLGATNVQLVHGWGQVLPFEVEGLEGVHIHANPDIIAEMKNGITILDEAVSAGLFDSIEGDAMLAEAIDVETKTALRQLVNALKSIEEYEQIVKEKRATLQAWMEQHGVLSIKGDGFGVSYVSPTTRKTFDSKKAIAKHPDLASDEFYKVSNVAASVKISIKE